ncbi:MULTISPECIES: MFS transporter [Clostridium]|uniref:MFS transporter n=1 Tax=Clostridium senegalense TaxID=1465809 RepID=A0A6M0H3Y8_9CLOT|nr:MULTISPECIES: MFS transporter [Clostridium]NEU05415.1 MFS transporter [Clostridium senegalense]
MSEELKKRYKHNSNMFIISYIFMGIMSGMAFDALVTFLNQAAPSVAASYSTYMGIATLLTAGLVALAPKLGYKKILISGPVLTILALVLVNVTGNTFVIMFVTLSLLAGVVLFDAILPPFLTQYTSVEERDKVFSRTLYTNVIGMTLATFSGGMLIVSRFASRLGITYGEAKSLSANIDGFTEAQNFAYTLAHKDVLLMFLIVGVLALLPLLLLKEVKADYEVSTEGDTKQKIDWKVLGNKYALLYLVYNFLTRFGASLITPYFSVFLGTLGIDRSTVSTLVTAQYAAMVIFMIFSPWLSKTFGRVVSIGALAALSIPFMLIIGNGDKFGSMMVLAVGIGLFFRSGLMNAANPIVQSLPMEFVTKELRPAYSSIIFLSQAVAQTLAGIFTAAFLFNSAFFGQGGYRIAYYITAVIYSIATIIILTQFTKKFNRPKVKNDKEEAA